MKKTILCSILFVFFVFVCMPMTSCSKNDPSQTSEAADVQSEAPEENYPLPEDIVYPEESLPKVHITTENGFQVVSKKEYSECTFRLELNDRYSQYTSTFTDEDGGGAQIRCRGNATYNNPEMKAKNKYSYKIKLDKKADILGLGKSKHWYLINNWRDTSNLRHKLAYDLAETLGLSHTDCQWVTVYYNGEYRGLYLLCESIRVDSGRVDTFNWEEFAEDIAKKYASDHAFTAEEEDALARTLENDLSWITLEYYDYTYPNGKKERLYFSKYYDLNELDLTTGYLIEYCTGMDTSGAKWKTRMGVPVVLDNPFMLHTNPQMQNYVKTLIQDFEDAVSSPTFYNSKGKHYSEYLDVESLVDFWIVWNFFCNNEFGSRSLYYYIDHGKIVFGPIWDFDQTIGNVTTVTTSNAKGDYWIHDRKNAWFKEIFGDPWFTSLCQERWYSIRGAVDDLIASVDIYFDYIGEEAERCYERNGIRYYTIRQPEANNGHSLTPTEDYKLIKRWLKNRVKWIDENFKKRDPNVDESGYTRSEKVFFRVSMNGVELPLDLITVNGVRADCIISPNAAGKILLSVTTTHTNARTVDAYLNGTEFLGNKVLTTSQGAVYEIDASKLNREEGAVNVIYLPVYRADKTVRSVSSVLIKVSSVPNPTGDECVIWFGNEPALVKKGTEIVFPKIQQEHEGFIWCGWTTGDDTLYRPGDTLKVQKDMYFYVRWKRTDMNSRMDLSR